MTKQTKGKVNVRNSRKRTYIVKALTVTLALFLLMTLLTITDVFKTVAYDLQRLTYIDKATAQLEECVERGVPLNCANVYRQLYALADNAPLTHVKLIYAIEELLDWQALKSNDVNVIRDYMVSKALIDIPNVDMTQFSRANDPDGSAYELALTLQYNLAKKEAYGG
jgi:hypothetical protein